MSRANEDLTVKRIRLSIASAHVLGLADLKISTNARPTTCYIMEYHESGCSGSCAFCSQTSSHERLSRVVWPDYSMQDFLKAIEGKPKFGRYCIQCLIYEGYELELLEIISQIRLRVKAPISAAVGPHPKEMLIQFKEAGLTDIGLSLDAATEPLYSQIKNESSQTHSWQDIWNCIDESIEIFGSPHVRVHIIVGLGETERDICEILTKIHAKKIGVSLFPFMPIKGTRMEKHPRVALKSYRKLQIFKYLLMQDRMSINDLKFNDSNEIIEFSNLTNESLRETVMKKRRIFQTNGCSACNRPYYTSRPGETQYDYPYSPDDNEVEDALKLIQEYVKKK